MATARSVPFRIGRYECIQYLGGGMCDVYRASDTEYGRPVVIKMLKPDASPDMRERFEREARVSMRIRHENAMVTYDFSAHEGQPYLVLEYLEGENLRRWIMQPHTTDEKLWIALQVARALEYLHANDIVYRDLKPENIYICPGNKAKLMDFGIARSADWGITTEGVAIGTAPYMSPEQIRGSAPAPSADIYGFGVVLFEILTGKRPFEGNSHEEIFGKALFSAPDLEPLRESNAPKAVVDIITRCLEKEPGRRFPSMKPIAATLQSCISEKFFTEEVLGVQAARPQGFSVKIAAVCVLALAVIAAGVTYWVTVAAPKTYPKELHYASGDMALISGGPAILGANGQTRNIPPFYLDETEVSNAAYASFCRCTPGGDPRLPVVNVTYDDAARFAKWAGKRLPTEDEWEKAARGPSGFKYPWGNIPDATRANVKDNPGSAHRLMPVDSFPQGRSPYGIFNMIGNAWEWTSSVVQPDPEILRLAKSDPNLKPPLKDGEPFYAVKGGSYLRPIVPGDPDDEPVPIYEVAPTPGRVKAPDIGFRCAKDVP